MLNRNGLRPENETMLLHDEPLHERTDNLSAISVQNSTNPINCNNGATRGYDNTFVPSTLKVALSSSYAKSIFYCRFKNQDFTAARNTHGIQHLPQ